MTTILNIIYKLSGATNITIGPSLAKGIKTVINIFAFLLSRGAPRFGELK